MNQEKIGKFIANSRKKQKLTQSELAEKLGVSEKAISNWENGRNMPDVSLFKSLCELLDISVNELISGEKIEEEHYHEKADENIINTIHYNEETLNKRNKKIAFFLITLGGILFLGSCFLCTRKAILLCLLGECIFLFGLSFLFSKIDIVRKRLIYIFCILSFLFVFLLIDYMVMVKKPGIPKISYSKEIYDNMIIYKNLFYDVYQINYDTENEYFIVDKNHQYTKDTIPISPFNRVKSGIHNLLKYKGDIGNAMFLISKLPLFDIGTKVEINPEKKEIDIYYYSEQKIKKKSIIDMKRGFLYNSVVLFALLEDVEKVRFYTPLYSYEMTRNQMENVYPKFEHVVTSITNDIDFYKYVESKMNEEDFVERNFKELFIISNVERSTRIEVQPNSMCAYFTSLKPWDDAVTWPASCQKSFELTETQKEDLLIFLQNSMTYKGAVKWTMPDYVLFLYEKDNLIGTLVMWSETSYFGIYNQEYFILKDREQFFNIFNQKE